MIYEIILKIVLTIVGFVVTGLLGYLTAKEKEYKKKIADKEENEETQNKALKTILQSNLTNTYYVYENIGEIPDYVYRNWCNMLEIYEKLGGNSYIHILDEKMKNWKIVKTDILK